MREAESREETLAQAVELREDETAALLVPGLLALWKDVLLPEGLAAVDTESSDETDTESLE